MGGVEQHAFHVVFPGAVALGPGGCSGRRPRLSGAGANVRRAGPTKASEATPAKLAAGLRGVGCRFWASWLAARHTPCGCRSGPISRAWLLFFALSLKRSGDCGAERGFAPRAPGSLTGRRSVQSDAEFVALESVLRAARQPLHSGVWPVRRLRSSINIATFPGRKARTVRRFNLIAPRGGNGRMLRPSLRTAAGGVIGALCATAAAFRNNPAARCCLKTIIRK